MDEGMKQSGGMRVITQELLDETSRQATQSERLRKNYNFHGSEQDPVNWMLNALQRGTYIPVHRHLQPDRDEMVILLRGSVASLIFSESGELLQQRVIDPREGAYGFHIPSGVWHGLVVLEDDTVVYEVKQGPFAPLQPENRASWSPDPADREAVQRFVKQLEQLVEEGE